MILSTRGFWRASVVVFAMVGVVACGDQKASNLDTTTTVAPVPTEGPTLFTTTATTIAGVTSTIITVPPTVPPPPTTCKPCNVPTVPPPPSTNKDDTTTADAGSSTSTATTTKPTHQTYTVKSGDTLGSIAATFHTTVAALQALNGISNPDSIYEGEVLKVS